PDVNGVEATGGQALAVRAEDDLVDGEALDRDGDFDLPGRRVVDVQDVLRVHGGHPLGILREGIGMAEEAPPPSPPERVQLPVAWVVEVVPSPAAKVLRGIREPLTSPNQVVALVVAEGQGDLSGIGCPPPALLRLRALALLVRSLLLRVRPLLLCV